MALSRETSVPLWFKQRWPLARAFFLMAIFLRTGSLWVSVIYHALWDFAIFMIGLASQQAMEQQQALEEAGKGQQMLVPLLLILPNVLYGAWLLRKVRATTAHR
ncbi:CPBP family glutamic-type intramembrane protease [Alloyangia mangrovi]|uniref:CPBP family glutamic-type intramembrane protease n=1 Tax=Alloyangia mangrovi TaxID=1779329 RepID=UPI0035D44D64